MAKIWAIAIENDLLDFEHGDTSTEAIRAYVERACVPPEDAKLLHAIPGDKVRDDVEIPGWLISALEYDPEFAFGPRESSPEEWGAYERALDGLKAKGIHPGDIVGWVRVDSVFDAWAPVVK
jgi:hypothetical protein